MRTATIPQMRARLKSAGVDIEYRSDKIVTRKAGFVALSFAQTFHNEQAERSILMRAANRYGIDMPAQS